MNKYELIQPTGPDFRDEPDIAQTFTWEAGLPETGAESLYVVRFCSERNPVLSTEIVEKLVDNDHAAYAEAQHAFPDDFLLYWCDDRSPNGKSLSMCLWTSPKHARAALQLPSHQKAVEFMNETKVYDRYDVAGFIFAKIRRRAFI